MPLRGWPLDSISADRLDYLVRNSVREGRTIEYKEVLPGGKDDDRKEFLRDVTSFANTDGGDLLYGVREVDGVPSELSGIDAANADAEITRLGEMIATGIRPRLAPAPRFQFVPLGTDRGVVVLRIRRSLRAPHMVTYKGSSTFHARLETGKHPMDVDEIRDAFLMTAEYPERIRAFHAGRVRHYEGTEGLAGVGGIGGIAFLGDRPRVVVHAFPFDAFDPRKTLAPSDLEELGRKIMPLFGSVSARRFNLDGFVQMDTCSGTPSAVLQIFRSGIIESAADLPISTAGQDRWIPCVDFHRGIVNWTRDVLAAFRDSVSAAPMALFVSVDCMGPCRLGVGPRHRRHNRQDSFDRPKLSLPEIIVEDLDSAPEMILRPMFDALWNASGFERCFSYNDSGQLTGE